MPDMATAPVPAEMIRYALYHYEPSATVAIAFAVLFCAITLLHFYQMIRTKTWICIPFFAGGLMEVVGYIVRIISAGETPFWTLGLYVTSILLLLVAPALLAASIYMILGRLIALTKGECHSLIPPKWLTKIFVAGDIVTFVIQAAGAGIMASKRIHIGQTIVIIGLVVQVIIFGFFIAVTGIFHYRISRSPTDVVRRNPNMSWKRHLRALYWTSAIVWIRSIFRLIEFSQGRDGYLMSTEIYLYIFDSSLMFVVMIWLAIVHPSGVYALLKGGKHKTTYKLISVRQTPVLEPKPATESKSSSLLSQEG